MDTKARGFALLLPLSDMFPLSFRGTRKLHFVCLFWSRFVIHWTLTHNSKKRASSMPRIDAARADRRHNDCGAVCGFAPLPKSWPPNNNLPMRAPRPPIATPVQHDELVDAGAGRGPLVCAQKHYCLPVLPSALTWGFRRASGLAAGSCGRLLERIVFFRCRKSLLFYSFSEG